jgi:hypothetical protein
MFLIAVGLVSILALLSGCAKAPQQVVDAANAALQAAEEAQANLYVPDLYNAAKDSLNAAMEEINAQGSKFALTRNYGRAQQLLEAATKAATDAQAAVAAKKDEVMAEAQNLKTQAEAAVEETKKLLAKAPKGKEGKEVLEQMQAELSGAETALTEATSAMDSGDFIGARDKVKAALEKANSLNQELADAISKKIDVIQEDVSTFVEWHESLGLR